MSYNIDDVTCPVLNAEMKAIDIVRLYKKERDNLPECNFLEEHYNEAEELLTISETQAKIRLRNLWWYGEGSGWAYKILIKKVLPLVSGEVEVILTWEGGDGVSGIMVKDGKVTECDVEQKLVPRKKR